MTVVGNKDIELSNSVSAFLRTGFDNLPTFPYWDLPHTFDLLHIQTVDVVAVRRVRETAEGYRTNNCCRVAAETDRDCIVTAVSALKY